MGEAKDTKSGVIPLLCTFERPRADQSQPEFALVFPEIRGDMEDLLRMQPGSYSWSGQLTERWLGTQCCQLAASLSAIHRIAALRIPNLPALRFFRSGRLATDVIKWLSYQETELGTLVFSNFNTEPPTLAEAPPEYLIYLNRPREHQENGLSQVSISEMSPEPDCEIRLSEREEEGKVQLEQSSVPFPAPSSFSVRCTDDDCLDDAQKAGRREIIPEKSGSRGSIRASKFQVWCLGTIWLKLITWFLLGPQGVKDHEHIFNAPAHASGFFDYVQTEDEQVHFSSFRVKPTVTNLIHNLSGHEDSTNYICRLLGLIGSRMLVVSADDRASSQEILKTLEGWENP